MTRSLRKNGLTIRSQWRLFFTDGSHPMATVAHGAVLQLDWSDREGTVTINPEDEDRFNMKVERVIQACQSAALSDSFRQQLEFLFRRLSRWINSRSDIKASYLTLRDGCLLFLVIKNQAAYDEAFEDALSDLDVEIARDVDLTLFRMNAMALLRFLNNPFSHSSIQTSRCGSGCSQRLSLKRPRLRQCSLHAPREVWPIAQTRFAFGAACLTTERVDSVDGVAVDPSTFLANVATWFLCRSTDVPRHPSRERLKRP